MKRLTQSIFRCWNCELIYNANYNGAIEIGSRFLPTGTTRQATDDLAYARNEQASSAFSIANFRPSVEVSGTTPLMLNVDCKLDKFRNVTCSFRGSFNVTFLIIAPHVGTYNISRLTLSQLGPFSPHPVSYFPGGNGMLVKVGNITISTDPPLQMKPSPAGGVPAAQPFERTIVVEVTGLTVTVPSRMGGNLNVTGLGSALAFLTYTDITTNTSVQRLFPVQVEIQISSA